MPKVDSRNLYMVVYVHTGVCNYAVYRIGIDAESLVNRKQGMLWAPHIPTMDHSLDPGISVMDEPMLLLGPEFPTGMAFFSFGSRIYMLGSDNRMDSGSKKVYKYDTVTGDLGVAKQQMLAEKYLPTVIKPVEPFDDRVYVLSQDLCGHDLEVFYPDHDDEESDSAWKFIGAPSYFFFPPFGWVQSHATLSDGFIILTNTSDVLLYYNIPQNDWRIVTTQTSNFTFLRPHVFAHDINTWFYFGVSSLECESHDDDAEPDGFLCRFGFDSNNMDTYLIGPFMYLMQSPAPRTFYNEEYLLYLGNSTVCVVRSGFSDPTSMWRSGDPLPSHHASIDLIEIDTVKNDMVMRISSACKIKQLDKHMCDARVCACFVI